MDLLLHDTWFLFIFLFLYNWSDDDLYTMSKLVARQTIAMSVFCVTGNVDAHYVMFLRYVADRRHNFV